MTKLITLDQVDFTSAEGIKNFLETKKQLALMQSKVDRMEQLYRPEIQAMEEQIHITKDGNVHLVPEMTADHLMNTIKCIWRHGRHKQVDNKYIREAKKRGLHKELLEALEQTDIIDSSEDDDFEEDTTW